MDSTPGRTLGNRRRLILVDDNPSQLKLYGVTLEGYGFLVQKARDGLEALELIKKNPPDGVVSDVLMPRLDGFRLCQALRLIPHLKALPIVLLTSSYTEPADLKLARDMGANALIVRTENIQRTVSSILDGLQLTPPADPMIKTNTTDVYVDRLARQLDRQSGALMESQERFRLIEETMNDVFFIVGFKGSPMYYISPGYEKLWGRTCESAYQDPLSWMSAVHPEDRSKVETHISNIRGGESFEYRIIRPDGTMRWIQARTFRVEDRQGATPRIVGSAVDITEQKKVEEELRQAQKMEAVGRLAGGVAHDFNNLLSAIMAFGGFVGETLPAAGQARDDLNEVLKAAHRAANLTRQLLAFSRHQVMRPETLDLNVLIRETEKMIRRLIGEDIEVTLVTGKDVGLVYADPGSIEQILMNLAVNARDVMPKGGKIVIKTSKITQGDVTIGMPLADYTAITVTDNGTGMTEDVREHLFEPFFTTKEIGKGTGLGLATCYGIVKQSNGFIKVRTQPGCGTAFTIFLPEANACIHPNQAPANAESVFHHGTGTILLVEDEAAVRLSTSRILREAGYVVIEAASGEEALRVLGEQAVKKIDALLTDVIMPGMSGSDLAFKLQELYAGAKVLYMSGYTADILAPRGVLEPGFTLLHKPFSVNTLLQKVHEVIGR